MRILSFSGGKDSTYLLKLVETLQIDKVVFADTDLELPCVYKWIDTMEVRTGILIERIKPDMTFEEGFYKTVTRGKRKGQIRGFPFTVYGCWIQRDLKLKAIEKANKKYPDATWILGLCKGEEKRMQKGFEYPLIKWGIEEQQVIEVLKDTGYYPPIYSLLEKYGVKKPRSGCWLCPKASLGWMKMICGEYPKLWKKLKRLEKESPHGWTINRTCEEVEKCVKGVKKR